MAEIQKTSTRMLEQMKPHLDVLTHVTPVQASFTEVFGSAHHGWSATPLKSCIVQVGFNGPRTRCI